MPTLTFFGFILPSGTRLTLAGIPELKWELPGLGMSKIRVEIDDSRATVRCDVERWEDHLFATIYKYSHAYARTCIDLVVFSSGTAYTLVFDAVVRPGGSPQALTIQNPAMARECTAYNSAAPTLEGRREFGRVLDLVIGEPALFLALNDLVAGVTNTDIPLVNCGRVLDGLRKIVAPGVNPKKGWPILHSIVNCAPDYMEWVSRQSVDPRHGDRSPVSGQTLGEALRRTWAIMNRFLEYRKRGSSPLPLADFPLLTS